MEVTLILCDAAQESGGKLYVLGGGWTHVALPRGTPFNLALGLVLQVPWDRTNEKHIIRALLLTDDGEQVSIGDAAVESAAEFELGRPPGLKRGSNLNAVMAMQINGLVLDPGGYVWEIRVNEDEKARAPFWMVEQP